MARTEILGVEFDAVTMEEATARCMAMIHDKRPGYVVTPNPEFVMACRHDPAAAALIRQAALVVPDGIGVIYAARILGRPLPARIPGIELGEAVLAALAAEHGRLFLLGAKPGIAEEAGRRLCEAHPGIVLTGTHDGYFRDAGAVAREIAAAGADVVLVCTGFPRQEQFMAAQQAATGAKLMLGLGGSLDVYAGTVRRAPAGWQRLGLEWLYRLLCQPSRIGRMMKLPAFLFLALRARLFGRKGEERS